MFDLGSVAASQWSGYSRTDHHIGSRRYGSNLITFTVANLTLSITGFNMGNDLATFVTYAAHLVDGNLVTDLLSIGGKDKRTGPDPPSPASVAGLNTHAVFEGV